MAPKRKLVNVVIGILLIIIPISLLRGYSDKLEQVPGPFDKPVSTQIGVSPETSARIGQGSKYVKAILDPTDTSFDRLQCTRPNIKRYSYLNPTMSTDREVGKKKYLFALILHQCIEILPRLLGSVIEAIHLLGPENCVLSIVEGRSDDGTYEVLDELQKALPEMGLRYHFQKNDLDTSEGERIQNLAALRNAALEPLFSADANRHFSNSSTAIFINDVAACPDDILELIHQREYQSADMTCAMDWTHSGDDPALFYDIWISRGITGETFFKVGQTGSWEFARDLFWNDEIAKSRLAAHKPFQVYACWNGATVFTTTPIIDGSIKFRAKIEAECFQGEPTLFCKDMWRFGYRKIAVVPSVNLQYTDETGKRIKKEKGYVHDLVKDERLADGGNLKISWQSEPPEEVKCMPSFDKQSFRPWNEGFIGKNVVG